MLEKLKELYIEHALDEAILLFNDLENHLLDSDKIEYEILHLRILYELSDYHEVIEHITKIDPNIELTALQSAEIELFRMLAEFENDSSKEIFDELNNLFNSLSAIKSDPNTNAVMADISRYTGLQYLYSGHFKKAKEKFVLSIKLYENSNRKVDASRNYSYLGIVHTYQGQFKEGLQYHQKSLDMIEMKYPRRLSYGYNNMGLTYQSMGDLDKAYEYYQSALDLFTDAGRMNDAPIPLSNMGSILLDKGRFYEALEKFEQVLEIDSKFKNYYNLSDSYYYMIIIHLETDNIGKAKELLEEFKLITTRTENPNVRQRYKLSNALILMKSRRYLNRAKSQEILNEIVSGPMIEFRLHADAQLYLCSLLLDELQATGEKEILDEILVILNSLESHAKDEDASKIQTEVFILKSQIFLIKLNLDCAWEYLDSAQEIIQEKPNENLERRISLLADELLNTGTIWENFKDEYSLADRVKATNITSLLGKMLYAKSDQESISYEEPGMFLIIDESGMKIYSQNFNKEFGMKEELVSGLLSALYGLSQNVFNTHSTTQRIKHEDYTVIIKSLDDILLCYAFSGPSYIAFKKINQFSEIIIDSTHIWNIITNPTLELTNSEMEGMKNIVNDVFI